MCKAWLSEDLRESLAEAGASATVVYVCLGWLPPILLFVFGQPWLGVGAAIVWVAMIAVSRWLI